MTSALKWKLVSGFLLVFLAGAVLGSLFGNWHGRRFLFGQRPPGALAQHMSERLRDELSLTPEQSAKIAPIVEQAARKLEAIRIDAGHRVHQTLTETNLQISPDLMPEQRTKLAALEEKHRKRQGRHRRFQKPPPPEPPPNP